MAEEENPTPIIIDSNGILIIQTLNVVSQKIIQVDKPTEHYRNREKIKIFIY